MSYHFYHYFIMADPRKDFSEIYDKYIEKIYRFIFLKVNSQDIAEDLTSETFLRVFESFKTNNIENPQAFLYRVARNLVTDHYREKGRTQVVSADYVSVVDPGADLEEKAILNSDMEQVRFALSSLKEDYQNVIVWHYLDDLPIIEVARMLDRSEEATRVLLHRALKSLRATVNKG